MSNIYKKNIIKSVKNLKEDMPAKSIIKICIGMISKIAEEEKLSTILYLKGGVSVMQGTTYDIGDMIMNIIINFCEKSNTPFDLIKEEIERYFSKKDSSERDET